MQEIKPKQLAYLHSILLSILSPPRVPQSPIPLNPLSLPRARVIKSPSLKTEKVDSLLE